MQYRVPQNIDQEDKILGPMTFIQLIYALIGGALLLVLFAVLPFIVFIFLAVPIAIVTISFALIKIQDQPFSRFFVSLILFLKQPKRRLWKDLDNPSDSDGLGTNFNNDLDRDQLPTVGKATGATATILPIATESPVNQPIAVQPSATLPVASPPPVVDAFDHMAGIAPIAPAEPAKPAKRLAVQTIKGSA